MSQELGAYIRTMRDTRGLRQADLAREIGVHVQTVVNYEAGRLTPPPDRLAAIARALNTSVETFVSLTEKEQAEGSATAESYGTGGGSSMRLIMRELSREIFARASDRLGPPDEGESMDPAQAMRVAQIELDLATHTALRLSDVWGERINEPLIREIVRGVLADLRDAVERAGGAWPTPDSRPVSDEHAARVRELLERERAPGAQTDGEDQGPESAPPAGQRAPGRHRRASG